MHRASPMDFDQLLNARRMCRDFRPDAVPPAVLDPVLGAAFRAPSAGNTDALSLVVLEHDRVAHYWATTLTEDRRAEFPWPGLLQAPVLAIPYVDADSYVNRYSRPDKVSSGLGDGTGSWQVPYWWVDGGAAVMAMLLAAESAGLGALFFGQFEHEPAVAETFGVPSTLRALGTIALGYRGIAAHGSRSVRSFPRARPQLRIHRQGWADGSSH